MAEMQTPAPTMSAKDRVRKWGPEIVKEIKRITPYAEYLKDGPDDQLVRVIVDNLYTGDLYTRDQKRQKQGVYIEQVARFLVWADKSGVTSEERNKELFSKYMLLLLSSIVCGLVLLRAW